MKGNFSIALVKSTCNKSKRFTLNEGFEIYMQAGALAEKFPGRGQRKKQDRKIVPLRPPTTL